MPENKGQNIHYLVSQAKVDGKNRAILFTVHDVPQKSLGYSKRAYVIGMSIIQSKKQSGPTDHVGSKAQTMDLTLETAPNVFISDILKTVNTERIRFVDKKKISGRPMQIA